MSKNILFIEDKLVDLSDFVEALEKYGKVYKAIGVRQARNYLSKHPKEINFDFIILDIMMPPEGLYELDQSEDGKATGILFYHDYIDIKDIPTIAFTAHDNDILLDSFYRNNSNVIGIIKKRAILYHEFSKKIMEIISQHECK